jgi:hypothetical protein
MTKIPTLKKSVLAEDSKPNIDRLLMIIENIFEERTMKDIRQVYMLNVGDVSNFQTMTDLEVVVFLIVYTDTQHTYTDVNYHISLAKKVALSLVRGIDYHDEEVSKIKLKYI